MFFHRASDEPCLHCIVEAAHGQELHEPVMVNLRQNYRTHNGVLAPANAVLSWLLKLFPNGIDQLDPEQGFSV